MGSISRLLSRTRKTYFSAIKKLVKVTATYLYFNQSKNLRSTKCLLWYIVLRQKTEIYYQMYAEKTLQTKTIVFKCNYLLSDYEARLVIRMENRGNWFVQVKNDLNRRIQI